MRISSRNQLKGTVVSITRGPINALVKVDIGSGNHVSATLTAEAVDDLVISEGSEVVALFKATAVLIGVEE